MFTKEKVISLANKVLILGKELKKISIYKQFDVSIKSDFSSVTTADIYSDTQIKEFLNEIFGNIPILSEEDTLYNQQNISNNKNYFIIDPIDGTQSFIAGDDFCINISYCQNSVPIFGMMAIPMQDMIYFTLDNKLYSIINENDIVEILKPVKKKEKLIVSTGKNFFSGEQRIKFDNFISKKNYDIESIVTKNAAIKYIATLTGISDMTINFGCVRDWDLAAIFAMCKIFDTNIVDGSNNVIIFGANDLSQKDGTMIFFE